LQHLVSWFAASTCLEQADTRAVCRRPTLYDAVLSYKRNFATKKPSVRDATVLHLKLSPGSARHHYKLVQRGANPRVDRTAKHGATSGNAAAEEG